MGYCMLLLVTTGYWGGVVDGTGVHWSAIGGIRGTGGYCRVIGVPGVLGVIEDTVWYCGVLWGIEGNCWALLGTAGHYWALLGTAGYCWVLLDTTGYWGYECILGEGGGTGGTLGYCKVLQGTGATGGY